MFYISTVGASGSLWLATAFSLHPSAICFHGTVRLPPSPEGGTFPALSPEAFCEGLFHLFNSCGGRKVFGALHGYHGLAARAAVMSRGGAFGALFRHPILRLHSLWHGYLRSQPATENLGTNLYEPFKGPLAPCVDVDFSTARLELGFGTAGFAELCHVVISKDIELLRSLPREWIFRIEDVAVDRDAFAAMFERVTNFYLKARGSAIEVRATDDYLDQVFTLGPINVHTGNTVTPDEIFEQWPDFFKFLFALTLKAFGGQQALADYANIGYALPSVLSRIDYVRFARGLWPGVIGLNIES